MGNEGSPDGDFYIKTQTSKQLRNCIGFITYTTTLNSKPKHCKELHSRNLLDIQKQALAHRVALITVFYLGC